MSSPLQAALKILLQSADLHADTMRDAVGVIMDGEASDVEMAALLTALRMKGESVDELVGAAEAMIARATRLDTRLSGLLDTCGTGGDQLHTFNISTATALVAAAAGLSVAKHGNRGVSSSSGSADVLEALGVNIQLDPERVVQCLHEVGIGFWFAPVVHGAMKHAAGVRKQLGFRTIFNLLGPLTNPAGAEFQLLGCHHPEIAAKLAEALRRLGRSRAIVVSGNDGLDEVSLWGETTAFVLERGALTSETWTAKTFGLPTCKVADLQVESSAESAEVIRRILAGENGPARDIVLANTAAALRVTGRSSDPLQAVSEAAAAIDTGKAEKLLQRLVEFTNA